MTRKAAKNFAFWLAADDSTTPVVGDAVAYVNSVSPQLSRPSSDVTVSGDSYQEWLAGIPGGTLTLSGVTDLTNNGNIQLIAAMQDGNPRNFYLVPDSTDTGDYFDSTGFVESLTPLNGSHDGSFEFTATIRLTGSFTWTSAV